MKKTKIVAVLTALMVMTSILGTACSKKDESSSAGSTLSSDSGVSLSIDPPMLPVFPVLPEMAVCRIM